MNSRVQFIAAYFMRNFYNFRVTKTPIPIMVILTLITCTGLISVPSD